MDLNKVIVLGTIPTADEERKRKKRRAMPKSELEIEERIDACLDCGCDHCNDEIDDLMDKLHKMDMA